MAHYQRIGDVPPKRHTQHRKPDGGLYYEELVGEQGFGGDSSLLYHRAIPSTIVSAEEWALPSTATEPNHPLKPRHFRLHDLFSDEEWKRRDPVTGRRLIVGNDDVRIAYVAAGEASPLYRNATGDECVYVEAGHGVIESVFGVLPFRSGDYVVVPAGTTHRWVPDGSEAVHAYCIEASSHITPPRRYLSPFGQFLESAPYSERDLHVPAEPLLVAGGETEVLVKHELGGSLLGTRYQYAQHPFDVVGWDGCCYPYTFNIADFDPITGRIHQPPPVHQVFEGAGFVICNFVPRKVDYHPQAIPVPYYHANVDSDEVMFYCGGNYAARSGSGIGTGSCSLHPTGFIHGPQPGAYEAGIGAETADEWAVMVDTFRPLGLGEGGTSGEDPSYPWSWSAGAAR